MPRTVFELEQENARLASALDCKTNKLTAALATIDRLYQQINAANEAIERLKVSATSE